jgi:hypothetical protein
MESTLSGLAFALLIGGQFLAAIVLISKRKAIYGEFGGAKKTAKPSASEQTRAPLDQELPAKAA